MSIADNRPFRETPKRLMEIVGKIVKVNEVQYEHVGYAGSKSENYQNFNQLKKNASTEDLVELTYNKNATVACYASWALVDMSYGGLKNIFNNFIKQDREVETFNGCIKSVDFISSELYHRYWNSIADTEKSTNKILFQLDSIILYTNNSFWLLMKRALENRVYLQPYKSKISVLAFDKGNIDAIFYLCNWHKAEYADEIKTALVKYLNETDFKKTGTIDYYRTIEALFEFKNPNLRKVIIDKMKKDRHWEMDKERFKYLLEDNYIYNIDNE
jgi:hypothetical protein